MCHLSPHIRNEVDRVCHEFDCERLQCTEADRWIAGGRRETLGEDRHCLLPDDRLPRGHQCPLSGRQFGPRSGAHDKGCFVFRAHARALRPCSHPRSDASSLGGRVEMWRGGLRPSLSVAAPFVWRCLNSRTITPFPHPARRTGRADFPHPALGQDITPSPTTHHTPSGSDGRDAGSRRGTSLDRTGTQCT
jgi:hypothetical protein